MTSENDWHALSERQIAWEAEGKPSQTGPLFVAYAITRLEAERKNYEGGEKMALLAAIRICALHELPLPDWTAKAFIQRYGEVLNCRTGSWDEAFGQPYPGKHVPDLRQRRELRVMVPMRIKELRSQDDPPPMNASRKHEGVYNQVAREFGVGRTYVTELWKDHKNSVLGGPRKT